MARMGWATQKGPRGPRERGAAAVAVALALCLPANAATLQRAMGKADPKAAKVARSLDDALGGMSRWESVPYVRFDFVVVKEGKELARFRHWWDKRHGRDRVEGPDEKGNVVATVVNLADRTGKSFTSGFADRDSASIASHVQNGYERWVNDSYWLMMPFKVRDPGTNLKYGGSKKGPDGVEWDVLELTFDPGVGLTPKDHYWLYVNRKTHLMDRWDYLLQDMKPPAQTATWEGWTKFGPVHLSTLHRFEGKPTMLRFENVVVPPSMDESIFVDARPKY